MTKQQILQEQLDRAGKGQCILFMVNETNAYITWRDIGVVDGVHFDKLRVAKFFYARGSGAWQQAKGDNVGVPWPQGDSFVEALTRIDVSTGRVQLLELEPA